MSNHSEQAHGHACAHALLVCINPYELIRKYRCGACGAVMMCECDKAFGRRFLPHQLEKGTELKTQRRVPVTLGFQPKVCAECRGLPAEPAPKAPIHGHTSKIKRYYWRELFFAKTRLKADWDEAHPDVTDVERREAYAAIEVQVLEEIKERHANAPKYLIAEPSQAEVLERYSVEAMRISAEYVDAPQKGAVIRDGDKAISPEAFVARQFEAAGWSVMPLESVPFHALFGVMMWLLVQDSEDPRGRTVGFGDRSIYEEGGKPPTIWATLPEDFGTEGYGTRREGAIAGHFSILPDERTELLWLFDYWRGHSVTLRQYLWAHRDVDVDRARRLIEILPPADILNILRYLVEDYWGHYLGWPDLLLHRGTEILLLEVKSSGDRLSQAQRAWIAGNHGYLHLPFKLVKLHRATPKSSSAALSAS